MNYANQKQRRNNAKQLKNAETDLAEVQKLLVKPKKRLNDDLNDEGQAKEEDLEDGEIEDDDEEEAVAQAVSEPPPVLPDLTKPPPIADLSKLEPPKLLPDDKKRDDKKRHVDKKHLTEAEKSVMRLHKLERMEREKREKYRREQVSHVPVEVEEDYATTLEKALAKVLKKDKPASDEEKPEEPAEDGAELTKKEKKARARKRRRRERQHKQSKKCKLDSPGKEDVDESEMLNVRGGSPGGGELRSPSQGGKSDEEDPYDSEASSDRSTQRKHGKRFEKRKYRDRSRERAEKRGGSVGSTSAKAAKKNKGICLHYLQGHCEDENCPYSHESVQPMKMELCKFYLQECCAKGDKCLYMHSEFPCKFYHTGIPCTADNCKFAHGGPLSESLKQILFKHIETAPKEILGNFPRLSREDATLMMVQRQASLDKMYTKKDQSAGGDGKVAAVPLAEPATSAGETEASESSGRKEKRNRPSRWQDPDPADKILQEKQKQQLQLQNIGFGNFKDQDMRINSNGDVDMRTLISQPKLHPTNMVNPAILVQTPPPPQLLLPNLLVPTLLQQTALQTALLAHTAVRPPETNTVDIEKYKMEAAGLLANKDLVEAAKSDTDIRQLKDTDIRPLQDVDIRQIKDVDIRQMNKFEEDEGEGDGLQIVMEEEENQDFLEQLPKTQRDLFKRIQAQQKEKTSFDEEKNEFDENEEQEGNIDWYSEDEDDNKLMIEDVKEEEVAGKQAEVVEKIADLSKIDISAEVSKLLSTMKKVEKRDPRLSTESRDPRRKMRTSTEEKSIYEQTAEDIDLRDQNLRSRTDVDLRQMAIPFKGMQNYTPATEIDASINSHPPINWTVYIVEIPKPDYTGLKLSVTEAQTTGDPRIKKIFKLSLEENDSPASPKESPKPPAPAAPRVDPRRRKMEAANANTNVNVEPPQTSMNYNQQLATLQSSPFYQTLTSNQKLILNQELASRNDQSGQNDPLIASILQSLGLISPNPINTPTNQTALSILSNINNLGFPAPNPNLNIGPGLLGPAPPIQNLPPPHDFFDPRNNLMNNGPPPNFGGNFPPDGVNNFYDNDYYPDQPPPQQYNGNNRDRFRDRPNRRGRNNNRNNRSFFRRHNRNNRNSPP